MKDKTLREFIDLSASKDPVPGGGGVSSLVASLAASLSEMVTNLTIGKPKYVAYTYDLELIKRESEVLRNNLLDGIQKDADAFMPLAKAYAMDKNDPLYEETLEKCLREAANSPMMILKYCVRIIELDEQLAQIGSKLSVSDAGTSVMLAHGALYGAYLNILVNTRLMKDKEYATAFEKEAQDLLDEYSVRALNCYDDVCERLR